MDKSDQIVAPFCVSQFVEKNSVELPAREQPFNAGRKRDLWTQNSVHCRNSAGGCESYRHTVSKKIRCFVMRRSISRGPKLATLSRYPETQPRHHQHCADEPHDTEHAG